MCDTIREADVASARPLDETVVLVAETAGIRALEHAASPDMRALIIHGTDVSSMGGMPLRP